MYANTTRDAQMKGRENALFALLKKNESNFDGVFSRALVIAQMDDTQNNFAKNVRSTQNTLCVNK